MRRFHLTVEQRRLLRGQLCSTDDVDLYRRTLALLEVDRGRTPAEIAQSIGVSRSSVYNWLKTFADAPQSTSLIDHRGQGRPTLWTDLVEASLRESLAKTPEAWGYQAVDWTVPLLQMHLVRQTGKRLSDSTIRRKLHELGYLWKDFRYAPIRDEEMSAKPPEFVVAEQSIAVSHTYGITANQYISAQL